MQLGNQEGKDVSNESSLHNEKTKIIRNNSYRPYSIHHFFLDNEEFILPGPMNTPTSPKIQASPCAST